MTKHSPAVAHVSRLLVKLLHLVAVASLAGALLGPAGNRPALAQDGAPPDPSQSPEAQALRDAGANLIFDEQSGFAQFIGFDEPERVVAQPSALPEDTTPGDAARAFLAAYGSLFGLTDQAQELTVRSEKSADKGRTIVRFQQVYQGVPVFGGELIVQLDDAKNTRSALGEVTSGLTLATTPTVDAETAAHTAVEAAAKWQGVDAASLTATVPQLWVYDPALVGPGGGPIRLVWRVEVASANLDPIRELMLIDAQTGGIALHFNQIDTVHGSSGAGSPALQTGTTRYVATTATDTGDCSNSASPCLTINYAIGQAAAGDTIKVAIGTYTSTANEVVLIDKNVTLSGGWSADFTMQSGLSAIDGWGRGISVYSGSVTATVERFSIQDGSNNYGGGVYNLGNLSLLHVIVQNNGGVGIYNDGGTLLIDNSTITGNTVHGIFNSNTGSGSITITNSAVINNIWAGIRNDRTMTLINSTVSGNIASDSGGGGGILNNGNLTINNSTISGNWAFTIGGGIYNAASGIVVVSNAIVARNSAIQNGPDCSGTIVSSGYNLVTIGASS